MSCPCPAYLPHLLNDNVESLYGDGVGVGVGVVRTGWESHGYVSGEGDRPFLARVNGDSLIGTRGKLPSFSLNTFKSLSASRLTHKKDAILLKL